MGTCRDTVHVHVVHIFVQNQNIRTESLLEEYLLQVIRDRNNSSNK